MFYFILHLRETKLILRVYSVWHLFRTWTISMSSIGQLNHILRRKRRWNMARNSIYSPLKTERNWWVDTALVVLLLLCQQPLAGNFCCLATRIDRLRALGPLQFYLEHSLAKKISRVKRKLPWPFIYCMMQGFPCVFLVIHSNFYPRTWVETLATQASFCLSTLQVFQHFLS